MRFKGNMLPVQFRPEAIQKLWGAQIKDLKTLRQDHAGSTIVALDTEGSCYITKGIAKPCPDVTEVGIAILPLHGEITQPYEGIKQMHREGEVSAVTIQIRERRALPKEELLGQIIKSEPKEVASVIESILAKHKGRLILAGYGLHNDLKWIVDECPTILSYFTAWLDVQELVMQRCKEISTEPGLADLNPPGLSDVLQAMHLRDQRRYVSSHHAVNDALRSLIVLCGLASNPVLLSDMLSKSASRRSVRCYSKLRFGGAQHPFMARISSAADGQKLPPWSPPAVARRFAAHTELKAVGLNWMKEKDKLEGVRFWQLSFHTVESLEIFITELNGSTIDTTEILASKYISQNSSERVSCGID